MTALQQARNQSSGDCPALDYETILRALDLLARVEESQDDIVSELRFDAKDLRRWGRVDHAETLDEAAAALVALKARAEKAEAERDALRGHAEAMANAGTGQVYVEANRKAVLAYRAAFPKDAP